MAAILTAQTRVGYLMYEWYGMEEMGSRQAMSSQSRDQPDTCRQ